MFLHVEKVLAFKVGIARRFTCLDSSSFDRGLDGSRARVRRIEDQRARISLKWPRTKVTIM
jgi:hypothetical protein